MRGRDSQASARTRISPESPWGIADQITRVPDSAGGEVGVGLELAFLTSSPVILMGVRWGTLWGLLAWSCQFWMRASSATWLDQAPAPTQESIKQVGLRARFFSEVSFACLYNILDKIGLITKKQDISHTNLKSWCSELKNASLPPIYMLKS